MGLNCSKVWNGLSRVSIQALLKSLLGPHLTFANNSAMFELINAEKTQILRPTSVPKFAIQLLRLLLEVQKDHVEAIWPSSSKLQKSFGRTLLDRHRSIFAREIVVTLGKDGIGIDVCFGLAFAASLPALSPISSLRISLVSSDISVTYSFQSIYDHNPWMRSIVTWGFDSDLNGVTALVVTDCYPPILDRASCFHGSTHFTLDNWSSRGNVYSRHE